MDRNCDAFIRSNNTYDILIARESLEISDNRAECIQNIGEKFVAEYFDRDEVPQLSIRTYGYSIIPKCFGLLDTLALETTGILQLQNQPALSLRGQGILLDLLIREFPMNCPVSEMPMEVQESAQSGIRVFRRGRKIPLRDFCTERNIHKKRSMRHWNRNIRGNWFQ